MKEDDLIITNSSMSNSVTDVNLDTITISGLDYTNTFNNTTGVTTITLPSNTTYNWSQDYNISGYTTSYSNVNITGNGIDMKEGTDIKIGGKSISEAIEKIEERLAILRPNEELEAKWENLRDLRKAYIDLEKEIIEKEKMWEILKKT